jgi:hypothetical protein
MTLLMSRLSDGPRVRESRPSNLGTILLAGVALWALSGCTESRNPDGRSATTDESSPSDERFSLPEITRANAERAKQAILGASKVQAIIGNDRVEITSTELLESGASYPECGSAMHVTCAQLWLVDYTGGFQMSAVVDLQTDELVNLKRLPGVEAAPSDGETAMAYQLAVEDPDIATAIGGHSYETEHVSPMSHSEPGSVCSKHEEPQHRCMVGWVTLRQSEVIVFVADLTERAIVSWDLADMPASG